MNNYVKPYNVNQLTGRSVRFPYQSMTVSVPQGVKTLMHSHTEYEKWIVTQGKGVLMIDEQERCISANEIVEIPPLTNHCILNSGDTTFKMVSLYWFDDEALKKQVASNKNGRLISNVRETLIIPAIVTPNGPMHLGHLSGPFIAADIMKRSMVLQGRDAALFLGTLGHQEHIAIAADKANKDYYELAEENTKSIKESFKKFLIKHDVFLDPRPSDCYRTILHSLFKTFKDKGLIYSKKVPVFVDSHNGEVLTEAYLLGDCPQCGSKANGHECESCGGLHQDWELRNVSHAITGDSVKIEEKERLFLAIDALKHTLDRKLKVNQVSAQILKFFETFYNSEIPDIPVSHFIREGVAIPDDQFTGQKFYISFEHLARYLVAIDEHAKTKGFYGYKDYLSEERPELQIFFGQDNAFSRVVIAPALLVVLLGDDFFPKGIHQNFFLRLNGKKFSTSANHAVWASEITRVEQVDALRFYLSSVRSELYETNFQVDHYHLWLTDWQKKLTQWFSNIEQVLELKESGFPEPGSWDLADEGLYREHLNLIDEFQLATLSSEFSTRKACRTLSAYLVLASDYTDGVLCSASSIGDSALRSKLALIGILLKGFILQIHVFMPHFSHRLVNKIQGADFNWLWDDCHRPLNEGTTINNLSNLTHSYFNNSHVSEGK